MKKVIIIVVVAVIVLVGGVTTFFLLTVPADKKTTISTASTAASDSSVKACDILTKDAATSLLGKDAILPAGGVVTESNADISQSSCMYIVTNKDSGNNALAGSGVQLYARIAKTDKGAASNKQSFATVPTGSQAVTGVGDKAFYNPEFRQLNVLKGGNWYLATYYVNQLTNATLDTDKQLVQKLELK